MHCASFIHRCDQPHLPQQRIRALPDLLWLPPDIFFANAGVSGDDWFELEEEVGKSGIPHRRLKPLIDTCPAATKDKPAHPHAPRNLTLAVNLQGAILTATVAQEY
jgi:hypothetical protein